MFTCEPGKYESLVYFDFPQARSGIIKSPAVPEQMEICRSID
jgi:hypothetical protein